MHPPLKILSIYLTGREVFAAALILERSLFIVSFSTSSSSIFLFTIGENSSLIALVNTFIIAPTISADPVANARLADF